MKEFMSNFKKFHRFDQGLFGFLIVLDVAFIISTVFILVDMMNKHESGWGQLGFALLSSAIFVFFIFTEKMLYRHLVKEANKKAEKDAVSSN